MISASTCYLTVNIISFIKMPTYCLLATNFFDGVTQGLDIKTILFWIFT